MEETAKAEKTVRIEEDFYRGKDVESGKPAPNRRSIMKHGRQRPGVERVYVKVNSDFDETGYIQPRTIIWTDGRVFKVDRVKDFYPDTDDTHRNCDCYTVVIHGEDKLLFFERADPRFTGRVGRWFIEKPASRP